MQHLPTVLLVDDDHTARYLAQRLLRSYTGRLRILTAENGQEALDLLEQRAVEASPTLVLLDLNMPVLDGFEFLSFYTTWSAARRAAVKVVIVSSSERPDEQGRAAALGVPFESKPMTSDVMARVLHQQLGELFVS